MKTCKNCGLEIVWEGMMVKVEGGYICHPDCGGDSGTVVAAASRGPRPAGEAKNEKRTPRNRRNY